MENKKFVVIGGGTGSFTVLRGLKKHTNQITAVVNMFDSGGSTGMLRDEFGVLPPGDVRRCLLALSSDEDGIMRKLFSFRFEKDSSFNGHSFGNLLLTVLTQITGNEVEAIKECSHILNIKGRVLPVTIDDANLCAVLENGKIIKGETNIDIPKHDPNIHVESVFLEPECYVFSDVVEAILEADVIVIGPGDLYTSVIPNLLVKGVPEAISQSKATKIYVCNLMTKHGETDNFKASDFAKEIVKYLKCDLDFVICNSKKSSKELLDKYSKEKAHTVEIDMETLKKYKLVCKNLITEPDLIRHDSDKLAEEILKIAGGKYE